MDTEENPRTRLFSLTDAPELLDRFQPETGRGSQTDSTLSLLRDRSIASEPARTGRFSVVGTAALTRSIQDVLANRRLITVIGLALLIVVAGAGMWKLWPKRHDARPAEVAQQLPTADAPAQQPPPVPE